MIVVSTQALLLAAPSVVPGRADANAGPSLVSEVTSHGVRLTLTVPRLQYPRNALIQVSLRVKNISGHTIFLRSGLQSPEAFVTDSSGELVFSPLDPLGDNSLFMLTGPGPRAEPLPKGSSLRFDPYLVLFGSHISYYAMLGRVGGASTQIVGRSIIVDLVDESAPQISIATTPTLQALVTPVGAVAGQMQYVDQTSCVTGSATYSTGDGWTATSETVIQPDFIEGSTPRPGCDGKRVWHGLVGWLGHPVAVLSYEDAGTDGSW